MNEQSPIKITGMPHAYVSNDGMLVELKFESAQGETIYLSFDAERFEQISSRAIELFTHARNQRLTTGDHLAIHPVAAVATMANSSIGGGMVLLSIRAGNGVPYHFAISPEEADALRPQLSRAAKSAKKQASQSRH